MLRRACPTLRHLAVRLAPSRSHVQASKRDRNSAIKSPGGPRHGKVRTHPLAQVWWPSMFVLQLRNALCFSGRCNLLNNNSSPPESLDPRIASKTWWELGARKYLSTPTIVVPQPAGGDSAAGHGTRRGGAATCSGALARRCGILQSGWLPHDLMYKLLTMIRAPTREQGEGKCTQDGKRASIWLSTRKPVFC